MKAASVHDIKSELNQQSPKQLVDLCLRLAKYKNDNKELLSYLLFEASNPEIFINEIKEEMDISFRELPKGTAYYNKKALRKILRSLGKYIKHIGSKQTEADLLLYFCKKIKSSKIPLTGAVLINLYEQQIKKINKALESLDEDLRLDYASDLELISRF